MNITNANDLPDVMTKVLSVEAQQLFVEIFNREKMYGLPDAMCFEIAWKVIKKRFKQVNGYWVAMSEEFESPKFYTFEMSEATTTVVMNSETEELVIEAILADNTKNTNGEYFTEDELAAIANQINVYGSTLPDVDHEKLQALVRKYGNDLDTIKKELQNEKGIFKSITALVQKGKLWIQASLDKRYKNHTDKFKKLSIETYGDKTSDGRITNPVYMGFTFTNAPKLAGAEIVSVKA